MTQIVTAPGEVNAQIVRDLLQSAGIHTTFGPADSPFSYYGTLGPNQAQNILVPKDKVEEAMKILKEEGLVKS